MAQLWEFPNGAFLVSWSECRAVLFPQMRFWIGHSDKSSLEKPKRVFFHFVVEMSGSFVGANAFLNWVFRQTIIETPRWGVCSSIIEMPSLVPRSKLFSFPHFRLYLFPSKPHYYYSLFLLLSMAYPLYIDFPDTFFIFLFFSKPATHKLSNHVQRRLWRDCDIEGQGKWLVVAWKVQVMGQGAWLGNINYLPRFYETVWLLDGIQLNIHII